MDFGRAQAYLLGTINETASRREPHRLDRMRAFLRELGDPQERYPTVHVGGTSGKGSTSTMIAGALQASGVRTGLHTKPHLRSMTERARVDGLSIAQERFAELLTEMMPAIERTTAAHGRPTYYETLLALAFAHFARERVGAAVIEVGIGGRLDGTNVLRPQVCIITNVGLDHTEILGDTLDAIAGDKAGIAKPGVPLVSAVEDAGARRVIEAHCAAVGAPFVHVLDATRVLSKDELGYGQTFAIVTARARYEIALPVLGKFQERNAATAILALEQLGTELRPSPDAVRRGLANVVIPGRMEYFAGFPGVVFDIAHNPDKAAHLAASLRSKFPDRRFAFVIAVSEGKDAPAIVRAFADLRARFVFTTFATAGRVATKPQRLASLAEAQGLWGSAIADPREALAAARRNAAADEIVVVTGSTFVVAELREWWIENAAAREPAR